MAQFRFGILPLTIETGQFRNQALDERLYTLCEFNEIEDESHFLFQCSLYDELRSERVSHIANKTTNVLELDEINKFKVIFDIHHRITVTFILRCSQLRKKVYTGYNVFCAHLSCICITCVYYSVLVKIVCSIHVFALPCFPWLIIVSGAPMAQAKLVNMTTLRIQYINVNKFIKLP